MSVVENSVFKNDSHSYTLKQFTVGEKGLEWNKDMLELTLVRGSKVDEENEENNVEKQDGVVVEQLLNVSAHFLKMVNVGDLRNRETACAITKIEEALMWLKKRQDDRANRGVLATYQK